MKPYRMLACRSQAAANAISEAFGKAAHDQLGFTVSTRAEEFQRALSLAFASVQAFSSTNTGRFPVSSAMSCTLDMKAGRQCFSACTEMSDFNPKLHMFEGLVHIGQVVLLLQIPTVHPYLTSSQKALEHHWPRC